MPAIATFGLSKKYPSSDKFALEGLDLNIMPGEIYGFLGPNGAGKSTTIRLLMNFIMPTRGHALILDRDVEISSPEIHKTVGYLAGEPAFYPKMTVREHIHYLAEVQSVKSRDNLRKLIKIFEIPLDQPAGTLSKGNRQKLGLIQAFMTEPKVLILDEPTSGLDPLMQEVFYELVREYKQKGVCIFLSSHNLGEVQKVCDRVGFIRDGKMIAEQSVAKIHAKAAQTYDVTFADEVPLAQLKRLSRVSVVSNTSHHATIKVHGDMKDLLKTLSEYKILSIDRRELTLEEEFLKFYRGNSH